MTDTFPAILVSRGDDRQQKVARVRLSRKDLMEGDVTVRVEATTVNYKDGLAITGKGPVVRHWPMVPGIDLAGTVAESGSPRFRAGDRVLLNGFGVGETHWGAYAQYARLKSDWLIPLPKGFSPLEAMAVGTAGYTAMLAVMALERHGLKPAAGPAIVTGAAGGVGSIALSLLAKSGWHAIASTGRAAEREFLRGLGAAEVIERAELAAPGRPLGKERWAAGIDSVGSHTLANLLAQTKYGGAIAACGLAQGADLPATVMPFILRGVSLLGIDSVMAARDLRMEAWRRLDSLLDRDRLKAITAVAGFGDIVRIAGDIVEGKIRGRVAIDMTRLD
jgi:acrylyl-CoA reductase (NADPH)